MNASRCAASELTIVTVTVSEIYTGTIKGTPTNPNPNAIAAQSDLNFVVTVDGQPLEGSVTESVTTKENFAGRGLMDKGTVAREGSFYSEDGKFGDTISTSTVMATPALPVPVVIDTFENRNAFLVEQTNKLTVTTNPYQVAGPIVIVHRRTLSNYSPPQNRNPIVNGTRYRLTHSVSVSGP